MSKTYYLIIEDSLISLGFCRALSKTDNSTFVRNYDDAVMAINVLTLQPDDRLYVVLDRDLGDHNNRDGVLLFFMISAKFPQAYIINFSSDYKEFSEAIIANGWKKELVFDNTISDKNAAACITLLQSLPTKTKVNRQKSDMTSIENSESASTNRINASPQIDAGQSCCCFCNFWPFSTRKNRQKVTPADSARIMVS